VSTVTAIRHCPGIKSPFGPHLYRKCTHECGAYRWGATGLVPAMKFNRETERRECPNMVPRGGA